jgi:hypothetical protein
MTSPKKAEWEDALYFEVMEEYLMTAELGHLAKDQVAHKEEMRRLFKKLVTFISQTHTDLLTELKERMEYLTHYYRSKYSQDCSRNETHEERSTEMIVKAELMTLIDSLLVTDEKV